MQNRLELSEDLATTVAWRQKQSGWSAPAFLQPWTNRHEIHENTETAVPKSEYNKLGTNRTFRKSNQCVV